MGIAHVPRSRVEGPLGPGCGEASRGDAANRLADSSCDRLGSGVSTNGGNCQRWYRVRIGCDG